MKFLLPLLLLLASCTGRREETPLTDTLPPKAEAPATFNPGEMRPGLEKLEQLRSGLLVRQSYDSLRALYAPDARICPENSTFITGAQPIVDYWKNFDGIIFLSRSAVSVEGTENILYETGVETCNTRATDRHAALFWNYKYLTIWKRNPDNSWQIATEMWNKAEK